MAKKRKQTVEVTFPFDAYLKYFLDQEHKKVYASFKPLSRKFLSFNNPKENASAFLWAPQFEALEMYVFLKEFCGNKKLWQIFEEWYKKTGGFENRPTAGMEKSGQLLLFETTEIGQEETTETYAKTFSLIKSMEQEYANYIFALSMGLGKTILMATCIFYEFLLANKYPKDPSFCHNTLVFAPDKTVLSSLREIQTFDKSKVVPPEYLNWLDANLKFYFLDDTSTSLSTIDDSDFNIIISNTQKIIIHREHRQKPVAARLFDDSEGKYTALSLNSGWSELAKEAGISDEELNLTVNSRFQKLIRLRQLGIYVDEAHHVFGSKLADDLITSSRATSLRVTINEIAAQLKAAGTQVVACYNFTGTPYVQKRRLPEVVYSYGLRDAINNGYLKKCRPFVYDNIRDDTDTFVNSVIDHFLKAVGQNRYEGMLPKIVFFASTIDEAKKIVTPAIERVLSVRGIPTTRILEYSGDDKTVTNDVKREFNNLDTPSSEKQFIVLVGRGKEGWNCRSLFGVAMHRVANSKVFVLQATMRCLRRITDIQQTAYLYISRENQIILDAELQENYNISFDDFSSSGEESKVAQVRLVPPPVKIKVNLTRTTYEINRKEPASHIDFSLSEIDTSKYLVTRHESSIYDLSTRVSSDEDLSKYKKQRKFSHLTLTAEIARYLNISPIKVKKMLDTSKEGIDALCEKVNDFNEILYDEIIPRLFTELFEITSRIETNEETWELVKQPKNPDYYSVKYKEGHLASLYDARFQQYKDKSFNLDNYCFDSDPELMMFINLLEDKRIDKVWFTGMLTAGQTDFKINYIDPESHSVRSYYPDFLVQKRDGSYIIIEVKGENKIDDAVVLAKQDYARHLAATSSMTYQMIPGKQTKLPLKL